MTNQWAKIYFVTFWVLGVCFFFNLVVGFVLDVFHREYVAERRVATTANDCCSALIGAECVQQWDIPGGRIQMKNGQPVGMIEVAHL